MRDIELFDYTPITEREPIEWPGGARVAFSIGLNVEHFYVDAPSTSLVDLTTDLVPDALNYGWRDYGARVGIWRLMEIFDRHGIRPSVLLNSDVPARYPQIIEAGRSRGWAWLAHGRTNSAMHSGFASLDEERRELTEIVETIEAAVGTRPRGWMGPGLSETFATPELLAELGLSYVLDWTNDDQPYELNEPGMLSLPYSVELNDVGVFVFKSHTGAEFAQMLRDQFDQLYAEATGGAGGRVMSIALHPFVIGQAFRARYLDEALAHIASHKDVWLATTDEIAEHYAALRS